MSNKTKETDLWATPWWVFRFAERYFLKNKFTLDAAANKLNKKCDQFITQEQNSLNMNWSKLSNKVWCNPPYSNPLPFVKKAIEQAQKGVEVVMLLNADNSTQWFKLCVENASEFVFVINKRIPFLHCETQKESKSGGSKPQFFVYFKPEKDRPLITSYISLEDIKMVGKE